MLPSPSLGPPLLSLSWSPPLPCGIPPPAGIGAGCAVVVVVGGGGAWVVVGGGGGAWVVVGGGGGAWVVVGGGADVVIVSGACVVVVGALATVAGFAAW